MVSIKMIDKTNMRKRNYVLLLLLCCMGTTAMACTNLIVGKNASVDGSTMITYSADAYGMFGELYHYPAAVYPKGTMMDIREWDTGKYLGQIKQAPKTYNVIGNMNEYQVSIAETTFGGRPELVDSTGILDYGSLIYIALQRSTTAKKAIEVMTDLVKEYGYCSSGESFTIADPNEVWVLEMLGKGPGVRGAVWAAVRIPDDCISAHANQSRIRQFAQYGKENCLFSSDVISFAREKNYFSGLNKDFSFADAYAPLDFGALRYCEARVWSFFRMFNPEMDAYLSYVKGTSSEPMPLYIRPVNKLSVEDLSHAMRDHYEGSALDFTNDISAGPFASPYRPSPLSTKVGDKTFFNERPISTQQTAFTFVAQMRDFLPNYVGGVLWFGLDDANMTVYTPVYCCTDKVPTCYDGRVADALTFSWESSFWVFNWVSNMVYPYYSKMIGDVRKVQSRLETTYHTSQKGVESIALEKFKVDPVDAKRYLTSYSINAAQTAVDAWKHLGEFLVVKHCDMVVRRDRDGVFLRNEENRPVKLSRPGYPEAYLKTIVKETGDRYIVPTKDKK